MASRHADDIAARKARVADLARREKAALAALDRAGVRLAGARARRDAVVARAAEAVAGAEADRDAALGAYARLAGAERAAVTLGEDVRELRRLARETNVPETGNGKPPPVDVAGVPPTGGRRSGQHKEGSGG